MRPGPTPTLMFLALAVPAASVFAADDVDLQVRGNEKVDGTLRPADERESFLVDVPRGARITASVKKTSDGASVPVLDLLDGALAPVTSGVPSATGAKLKAFTVAVSDRFRLRVGGDGTLDGDYQFLVKVAPQKLWSLKTGPEVAAGADATFAFAAPAGSSVDVDLRPAKGSAVAPRIVDVSGPSGFLSAVDSAGATARRHHVRGLALGASGEYVVRVHNDGAAASAFSITVRVAAPRVAKSSLDIRDSELTGSFGGDAQVFGRVVDAAGALVDPDDAGGPLDGCSVSVPANAVPATTVISIQSSETFFVDDSHHASGVAISLRPSGTIFATPVTVTVPYDPQAFDDPLSDLTIYIQNAETGALEAVPRSSLVIDTIANTVSFPTSHFSRFQGTSARPRPVKGQFVELLIAGRTNAGFGGKLTFGLSLLQALPGRRTGNGFSRNVDRRSITYDPSNIGHNVFTPSQDFGTVTVVDDDTVTLQDQIDGAVQYERGRNPDVLIRPGSQDTKAAAISVLLRVAKGMPTPANVAGEWNAFVFEAGATKDSGGAVFLTTAGQRTRLTFGLDGSVRAGKTFTQIANLDAAGGWRQHHDIQPPAPGTFSLAAGRVVLDIALGASKAIASVALVPVVRGDMLVGVADDTAGPAQAPNAARLRVVVLVREAVSAGPRLIESRSIFSSLGLVPADRAGPAQDLQFLVSDADVVHDDAHGAEYAGTLGTYSHDDQGAPAFATTTFDLAGAYFVAGDGSYRETAQGSVGAVLPGRGVYVTSRFGPMLSAIGVGVVARPKQ